MADDTGAPLVLDSPHTAKLKDRERERMLNDAVPEMHRIACPYEPLGAAVIEVKRKGTEAQIPAGEMVKCLTCGKWFEIAVRIKLYGKALPTG